jgi:hypothetical protein
MSFESKRLTCDRSCLNRFEDFDESKGGSNQSEILFWNDGFPERGVYVSEMVAVMTTMNFVLFVSNP